MRETLHILFAKPTPFPPLHPRPRLHIRNRILALPMSRQIFPRLSRVLATEVDLQDAVDAECFVFEAGDGVGDFLGGCAAEVVDLALVGGAGAVPELEGVVG